MPERAPTAAHEAHEVPGPPALRARGLVRSFDGVRALDGLDLDVAAGELCVILGASGSGKTTALRLIAGFERPDEGAIELFGERVAGDGAFVAPERRGVGMVFQDYALFPHLSVEDNVAYGLPRGADRATRVREVLELTGLGGLDRRAVHELSGGEQQRTALARALAPQPRLLLLDEPFSNLDPSLRARVRGELREILRRAGTTTVLVTHDQEEALSIADRVAFLWEGRVEQYGTPREIYLEPGTLHVAESIGDAIVLRLPAAGGLVRTPFGDLPAPPEASRCAVVIRPEDVLLRESGTPAEVCGHEFYGHDQMLHVRLAGGEELRVRVGPGEEFAGLDRVALQLRRPPLVFADSPAATR